MDENIKENIEQIEEKVESKLKTFVSNKRGVLIAGAVVWGVYMFGKGIGDKEGYSRGYVSGHNNCFRDMAKSVTKLE